MQKDIEIIEELTSNDLSLRKVSNSDVEFYLEGLKERQIIKYLSLGPLRDANHSKSLIKNYLNFWDNHSQFNYIIERIISEDKKERIKVGSISLWNISWLHKRASVGIWLRSKYWNQGLGKNSINIIKIISFHHLKLHRLEAHIAIENNRSICLFKKCGFEQEGLLKEYLNFRGRFHNAVLLACVNDLA